MGSYLLGERMDGEGGATLHLVVHQHEGLATQLARSPHEVRHLGTHLRLGLDDAVEGVEAGALVFIGPPRRDHQTDDEEVRGQHSIDRKLLRDAGHPRPEVDRVCRAVLTQNREIARSQQAPVAQLEGKARSGPHVG